MGNANVPPDLRVAAFHLGKCWFKLIHNGNSNFKLQQYGHDLDQGVPKPVQFRLVPNAKDLMGARTLTGLKDNAADELKDAVMEQKPREALRIIQEAQEQSTR